MDVNDFKARLAMAIYTQGAGRSALFAGFCTADLRDGSPVFREISGDGPWMIVGEEFSLDDVWDARKTELMAWLDEPAFTSPFPVVGNSMKG